MDNSAQQLLADQALLPLNARLDILRTILEQIRSSWMHDDIQDLRDKIEQRARFAANLPLWVSLYRARGTPNSDESVAQLTARLRDAIAAVNSLRERGEGDLPADLLGDWTREFLEEYRRVRSAAGAA